MTQLRVLHTADWQIGKPYGTVADEQKRFRLQQERLAAIGRIRDVVRLQEAQLVLVAGDLFDSPTPATSAVLEVLELIGEMEVPVLVIPGNHDHGAPGTVWHRDDFLRHQRQLAPNLQLLLERQPLVLDQAVVLPCPLLRNQDRSDPTQWLRGFDWSSLPADRPRIVLAHGGVHGFGGRDYEGDEEAQAGANNLIDLAALPAGLIDYIALGDWHNLKQVTPQAWYPGTPEPDRFDQGDDNQRGQVLLVELQRGATPEVRPQPTGRIRWHNLQVRFSGDGDLDRFERQLEELTAGRVARDLLRLEVSGSLSLAGHRRYQQLIDDLTNRLLRLRIKGECQQAPEAAELEALTARSEDPLIAQVAQQLQNRLSRESDPDSDEASRIRTALCELFHFATTR
ncbi:metallophosphoesterase [Vulcanococcus limneticus]|uniref:metallophosphoesterase family protein n=1 Tax=Vulcanococcus limneticus TaxID=2170428 RepID=UPI00398BFBB5